MKETKASRTASWVASARSFGSYLPTTDQLCEDPYGIRFAPPWLQLLERAFALQPTLARRLWPQTRLGTGIVRYMQLRTRFIDDALRDFTHAGGAQVVLLGAGYDSRALRLSKELPGVRFFEVDHPATQAQKRSRLPELEAAGVRFVRWNFLKQPVEQLPAALFAMGLSPGERVLTVWEGVTMYLDATAVDETVRAAANYSPAGSVLVFNYMDSTAASPSATPRERALHALVASVGEPFTFGWDPDTLPGWLAARGFQLRVDSDAGGLARQLLPGRPYRGVTPDHRRFVIADRQG